MQHYMHGEGTPNNQAIGVSLDTSGSKHRAPPFDQLQELQLAADDSNGGGQKMEDTQRRSEGKTKADLSGLMIHRLHDQLMKVSESQQ